MIATHAPHCLIGNFDLIAGLLGTYGPESLQVWRRENLGKYAAVGLPTSKDEEFKYLPLSVLAETELKPAYSATVYREDLDSLAMAQVDAITLTFVNGEYAPELSNTSGLPNGSRVMSLQEALEHHEGLVMRHLGKIATLDGRLGSTNDERFTHLNSAYLSEGAYIFVSKGVAVETPIHLLFISKPNHGPFVAHPRVLIHLEENAQAKVIESYIGLSDGLYFTNAVTEVVVAANAILEHTKVQEESAQAVHVANVYCHQEGNSTYTSNNASFGSAICRNDINAFVDGEHTETWLNGAYLALDGQIHDNHTRIDHAKPNCHSFEVYKGILGDRSVGVFNGKIFVYEDAQKTDAKQTNQALLLAPTATINTKPQLEIFADDVKCTHGATVGQLREDAMFYLRARGIPADTAKSMLVYAFAAEVLDKITVNPVREAVEAKLYARLNG